MIDYEVPDIGAWWEPGLADLPDNVTPFAKAGPIKPRASAKPWTLTVTNPWDIDLAPVKHWVVRGLIGKGEMVSVFAPPGGGKSVIVADIGCHIAAGIPWHGRPVKRGAVIYIAAERHKLTERRFAAWIKHHGLDPKAVPFFVVSGHIDFRNSRDHAGEVIAIAKSKAEAAGLEVALIVIDTLARTLVGGEENSSKDMGAAISNAAEIQSGTGATVMIIHHTPQSGDARMRGHGSLLGALDTTAYVEKTDEGYIVAVDKENDGLGDGRFGFTMKSILLAVDEEGCETSAPVAIAMETTPAKTARQSGTGRPSKASSIYMDVLSVLLGDDKVVRKERPYGFEGPVVQAVEREAVRTEFYRRIPDNPDSDERLNRKAKEKRFNRGENSALDDGLVCIRAVGEATIVYLSTAKAEKALIASAPKGTLQ